MCGLFNYHRLGEGSKYRDNKRNVERDIRSHNCLLDTLLNTIFHVTILVMVKDKKYERMKDA